MDKDNQAQETKAEAEVDLEKISHPADSLLSARNIVTGYGDLEILHGIDIDIKPNEIVMVFGPNGAGKSTLVKALYRLIPLWEGKLTINGTDISAIEASEMVEHGIGYVPQNSNIFPNLTVAENLEIGGTSVDDHTQQRDYVYELFPILEEKRSQRADELSGGQQKMVAIGRALMSDPELLFIDEPSAGLAPQLVDRVFEHIQRINESGIPILMIEQNVSDGLSISDRAYVIDSGENRFEGPAEQIRTHDQIRDIYLGK